jgi:hypothetical protein
MLQSMMVVNLLFFDVAFNRHLNYELRNEMLKIVSLRTLIPFNYKL